MPYITAEKVSQIRKEVKKAYPKFKWSITKEHSSTVVISLLESPIEVKIDSTFGYMGVNHFYIKEHYEDNPELRDILLEIYNIARNEQREIVYDGDYGSVPNYYIDLNIGKYGKPYKKI